METLNSVVKRIPKGAVMATIDLKDAYYHTWIKSHVGRV